MSSTTSIYIELLQEKRSKILITANETRERENAAWTPKLKMRIFQIISRILITCY